MRTNKFLLLALIAGTMATAALPALAKTYSGSISGTISDSMCQFDHSGMIKSGHGTTAATCTQKCVKEGNKLVLCDPKTKIVYKLTDAGKVKKYAGKSVTVAGHIDTDSKTIHVHSVKAK
jgi:hypothetical protein